MEFDWLSENISYNHYNFTENSTKKISTRYDNTGLLNLPAYYIHVITHHNSYEFLRLIRFTAGVYFSYSN